MKKVRLIIIVFIAILTLIIINLKSNNIIEYNKVPTLSISLKNITLDEINNNSKKIKYKDNNIKIEYDNKTLLNDNITIKGRGNSTWYWLKKPYQIKFDKEINLFNLGKAEKWVLLANYADETLIRNHMAFYLGKTIEMEHTNRGINVDLYIDGEYLGVYYLTPKIAINSASVNLKNDDGIVMELDNNYFFEDDNYYTSNSNDHFVVKDINDEKNLKKSTTNFINNINKLEECLNNEKWECINSIIDVDSFAKYYIITNLTKNGDAYRSSFYMYMDGKNDKIHAGPIWDFDLAFSSMMLNKNYFVKTDEEPKAINIHKGEMYNHSSQLIYKLLSFKEFQNIIKDIWNNKMKDTLNDTLLEVDRQYSIVKDSAENNMEKWNYPNTYKEYIDELKDIIKNLYERFDSKIKNENW